MHVFDFRILSVVLIAILLPCSSGSTCEITDGYFQCKSGSGCIHLSLLCNGAKDCSDGSDEGGKCSIPCPHTQCPGTCKESPTGYLCYCNHGYRLNKATNKCEDVDECGRFPPPCTQLCRNSPGSFSCSCSPGYRYNSNHSATDCVAIGNNPQIIFMVGSTMVITPVRAVANILPIKIETRISTSPSFGVFRSSIAVVDASEQKVTSFNIRPPHDITSIVDMGLGFPSSIAVDHQTYHLYITDSAKRRVVVCTPDGSSCAVVVQRKTFCPVSVVVDPINRMLYWSEDAKPRHSPLHTVAITSRICSSNMDGSNITILLAGSSIHAHSLTLDQPRLSLYWVNSNPTNSTIDLYDLRSHTRRVVVSPTHIPHAVAVFEDRVYWTSTAPDNHVYVADKFLGRGMRVVDGGMGSDSKPYSSIIIHHPSLQSSFSSHVCLSSRCSHICVPMLQGHVCLCPQQLTLASDNFTCKDHSATSIIATRGEQLVQFSPWSIGRRAARRLVTGGRRPVQTVPWLTSKPLLAAHWGLNFLFVTSESADKIIRLDLETSKIQEVVTNRVRSVTGLAVDWLAANLYWSDRSKARIEVSRLDGSSRIVLTGEKVGIRRPTLLAVDPVEGLLVVVEDTPVAPALYRCDLSVTDCSVFYYTSGPRVTMLLLDARAHRVHWLYREDRRLHSMQTDGTGYSFSVHNVWASSMTILNGRMYWSNAFTGNLQSVSMNSVDGMKLEIRGGERFQAVIAHDLKSQPFGVTACSTSASLQPGAACSHMCLLRDAYSVTHGHNTSHVCACPPHLALDTDRKTCVVPEKCPDVQCSNGRCMRSYQICDGVQDCPDGSDEMQDLCPMSVQCERGQYKCANGQCISMNAVCDGQIDCMDKSDETHEECNYPACTAGQLQCDVHKCVRPEWLCDDNADCDDGQDEANCTRPCRPDELACKKLGLPHCLANRYMCDGIEHCDDGEDESNEQCNQLVVACKPGYFTCADGSCILAKYECDGKSDCQDYSDEDSILCASHPMVCPEPQVACGDSRECVPKQWMCDGDIDCYNGADEKGCDYPSSRPLTCDPQTFACLTPTRPYCAPYSDLCDGHVDCLDEVDEDLSYCVRLGVVTTTPRTITTTTAPLTGMCHREHYTCKGGMCVGMDLVCDGIHDCPDQSDEGHHCAEACQHVKGGCSHICLPTPSGPRCACPTGFLLSSGGKTCEDVDECGDQTDSDTRCSHLCFNTKGSYHCTCHQGYMLGEDDHTCVAKGEPGLLLASTGLDVLVVELGRGRQRTHTQQQVAGDGSKIHALDYSLQDDRVFWYNQQKQSIVSHGLAFYPSAVQSVVPPAQSDVVVTSVPSCGGLAYDWLSGTLYYTEPTTRRVRACVGGACITLLQDPNTEAQVGEISLHPANRLMFWFDTARLKSKIWLAWMDGRHSHVVVSAHIQAPRGLVVDLPRDTLYWMDALYHSIESTDLYGRYRHTVLSTQMVHPFGLAVFEDQLYWTDWGQDDGAIYRVNKFSGEGVKHIMTHLQTPSALKVVHAVAQPQGTRPNECRGHCSHLCLLTPEGAICACPDGLINHNTTSCYTPPSPCSSSPCLNDGWCENIDTKEFICHCPVTTWGPLCESLVGDVPVFRGSLRVIGVGYTPQLDDRASQPFMQLRREMQILLQDMMTKVLETPVEVIVIKFTAGSVVVHFVVRLEQGSVLWAARVEEWARSWLAHHMGWLGHYRVHTQSLLLESPHVMCEGEPCSNGGTCQPHLYNITCLCPSGFVGSRCDNRTGVLVAYPLLAHNSYAWVAGVVGFLVVFTVLVVGIVYCCRRRRRGEDNELISIIKFRSALRGRHLASSPDSSMRSLGGGDTSYENPNFIDQEDENANNPQSKVTLVMSPSDDSLDSAFVSTRREDSLDFMEGSSDVRLLDSNQYDSP